jgi:hypothetical protein
VDGEYKEADRRHSSCDSACPILLVAFGIDLGRLGSQPALWKDGPTKFAMARWRVKAMLLFLKALPQLEGTTVMGMKYDSSH